MPPEMHNTFRSEGLDDVTRPGEQTVLGEVFLLPAGYGERSLPQFVGIPSRSYPLAGDPSSRTL